MYTAAVDGLDKEFIFFLSSMFAFYHNHILRGDGAQGGAVTEHGRSSLWVFVSVVEPSSFHLDKKNVIIRASQPFEIT